MPREPGHHRSHHPGAPSGPIPPRRRGRGRVPRGDVRLAVLLLLAEGPMHGYQLMQAIRERSGGRWTPSPGAIYPTISQLEDEGLVSISADAGRKLATLTDTGRQAVETERESRPDPFVDHDGPSSVGDYRRLLEQLQNAAKEVARNGNETQSNVGLQILRDARRSLYLLLADADGEADAAAAPADPR